MPAAEHPAHMPLRPFLLAVLGLVLPVTAGCDTTDFETSDFLGVWEVLDSDVDDATEEYLVVEADVVTDYFAEDAAGGDCFEVIEAQVLSNDGDEWTIVIDGVEYQMALTEAGGGLTLSQNGATVGRFIRSAVAESDIGPLCGG